MQTDAANIPAWLHPSGYVECFQTLGIDPEITLSAAGLPCLREQQFQHKITLQQQHNLILSGVQHCHLSWPGLRVGLAMPWCYYGVLATTIDCSPNLREAGAAFRRYTPIAQPHQKSYMSRIDYYLQDESTLRLPLSTPYAETAPAPVREFDFQYRLAITARILHACGYKDKNFTGLQLYLRNTEEIPRSLVEQLGVERIHYGAASDGISANHRFFTEEWRPFRKPLFDQTIADCERDYRTAGLYDSLEDLVRWHVDMSFIRETRLEDIAEKLCITPRTLNRKLAESGTSFREIVHESKMNHAIRHIKYSNMSTRQLIEILGYSAEYSLARAVKNWSGFSISELRRQAPYRSQKNSYKSQQAQ